MSMDVIILGSGTAIPMNDRASPSIAVEVDGSCLLFDMGPGALRHLTRAGIDYERVERIFLTHFHPDHTADLIHFMFASRNPAVLGRRRPFTVTGPPGTGRLVETLQAAYPNWLTLPPHMMGIEERDMGRCSRRDYGDVAVITTPAAHTSSSLAYRVEDRRGKAVVYSGDTEFCDALVDLARGADLLILESSFPDGEGCAGHLTPSLAGRMASMAGVRRLVLVHFYPECLRTDAASQCRKTYSGELTLGEDLLRIRV